MSTDKTLGIMQGFRFQVYQSFMSPIRKIKITRVISLQILEVRVFLTLSY